MKFIVNVFLAFGLSVSAAFIVSGCVHENPQAISSPNTQALMIIRFNQKEVNYQNKLAYVVREAMRAKPGVIFDVVSASRNKESQHGQEVANNISRLGVPQSQINLSSETSEQSNEEVRIFVR